jgi:ubiquinone biosynthesis protein COQ9
MSTAAPADRTDDAGRIDRADRADRADHAVRRDRDRILDAALELGRRVGWDALLLHRLAAELGLTLAELQRHFDGKDALAEAWFDRADAALLAAPESPGWAALEPRQRLHAAIFAWLDALAPQRGLTQAMLRYKMQPEHLHLQALGALRVSRTVQWIREVAALPSTGWRREAEEAVLTTVFLASVASWLGDDSPGASSTRRRLARWLALAGGAARWLDRAAPR